MSYTSFNLQHIYNAFYQHSANQDSIFTYIPEYYKNRENPGPKQYDFICLLFPADIVNRIPVFQNKGRLSELFRGQIYSNSNQSNAPAMYKYGFKSFFKSLIDLIQNKSIFSEMQQLCDSFLKKGYYNQSIFADCFTSILQTEKNCIIENDIPLIQNLIHNHPAKALTWFVLFAVLEKSINSLHSLFFGSIDYCCPIPVNPDYNNTDCSDYNSTVPGESLLLQNSGNSIFDTIAEFEPHFILPACVNNFCGRQRYLSVIHSCLHSCNSLHHIFLYGISGIGKTEIAKHYAHKFRKFYNVILFISDPGTILNTVCNEISLTNFQAYSASDIKSSDAQAYFAKKLQHLQKISNEHVLLIIDNFNAMDDENLEVFLSGEYSVIFTTQTDFSEKGYVTLPILPFEVFSHSDNQFYSSGNLWQFYASAEEFAEPGMTLTHFQKCLGKNILPDQMTDIQKIFEYFEGHPFMLELIAKQMRADRLDPQKMLSYLDKNGILMPENFSLINHRSGTAPGTIYSYVKHIISPEKLQKNEQYILKNLAVLPLSGISAKNFCKWCNIRSFNSLNDLIHRSYIKHDIINDSISLHPLIRELIYCNMKPSAEDVSSLILSLSRIVSDCWNKPLNAFSLYNEIIISVLTNIKSFSLTTVIAYESLTSFCWQINQFKLAVDVSESAYQFAFEHHADNQILGLLAKSVGNSLYSSGEKGKLQSTVWFKKMWDFYVSDQTQQKNIPELILAAQRISRYHVETREVDKAEFWLKKAEKIIAASNIKKEDCSLHMLYSMGDFYYMYACLEILRKDPEKALSYAESAISFYMEENGDIVSLSLTAAMTVKAKACTIKKKFNAAKHTLASAFQIENQYRGKLYNSHLIRIFIASGDLSCWRGNLSLAKQNYEEAIHIIQNIYDPANERFLNEIKQKLSLCDKWDLHSPLYVEIHTGL
ncbi:MAG: ATP-binding protein [Lachnospiraceae bacterium]|nr:ATP-binding protein [Lachnospiraceae bacterium]